jgi:carboxypeptidase family protein
MNVTFALVAVLLQAATADAQSTIKGCVTDQSGGVLPGVELVATGSSSQTRAVTDSSGCYELRSMRAGTYSVTATLAGFATGERGGVALGTRRTVDHLDFALCLAELAEIDWVVPGGLAEAWKQADVVAYVRIAATGPVPSACPTNDSLHTAAVIEMFKGTVSKRVGTTLTFRQENWVSERTPYAIGQKMILFLTASQQGLSRLAGPYYVFLVNGDEITGFHSSIETDGMTPADFAARLRALAKGSKIP